MSIAFGESASLSGLLSARPSPDPAQVGRFYLATDEGVFYRDSGTAWVVAGYTSDLGPIHFQEYGAGNYVEPIEAELESTANVWTPFNLADFYPSFPDNMNSALLLTIARTGALSVRGTGGTGYTTPAAGYPMHLQIESTSFEYRCNEGIYWAFAVLFYTTTP